MDHHYLAQIRNFLPIYRLTKSTRQIFSVIIIVLLFAINQHNGIGSTAATWYVSPAGNDSNACTEVSSPCATIQAALTKATPGDIIYVSVGVFTSVNEYVLNIDKNINISGGWNSAFNSRSGFSVLDGQESRGVIKISLGNNVNLEYLEINNGYWADSGGGGGIMNQGNLTIQHSLIHQNRGESQCQGGGISNYGSLRVIASTIRDNQCGEYSFGGGIYSGYYGGPTEVIDSTVSGNVADQGAGIYAGSTLTVTNSTVSGNTALANGSAAGIKIETWQPVSISNSTITENNGSYYGGGISAPYTYSQVTLRNSIVAGNLGSDCAGEISSLGFNLIQNTTDCLISPATGDLIGSDPELAPLADNGGTTETHALYADSPAIEAGDPLGCTDAQGILIPLDQRGEPRSIDGDQDGTSRCDIGSYEFDPEHPVVPPPETTWYVSPSGNDAQNCNGPTNPCATVNGALSKALFGDQIKIAVGTYTGTGDEVVLIDKDIQISGGWNESFSQRIGRAVIEGEASRRGITIQDQLKVGIEYLTIQNGLNATYLGGGMYIGGLAQVELSHINLINNHGGGMHIWEWANVKLSNCTIQGNGAINSGRGIDQHYGTLEIDACTISDNSADNGAGVFAQGALDINGSVIRSNVSSGSGGGIYMGFGTFNLTNSIVFDNKSINDTGGGISAAGIVLIDRSMIQSNKADTGGGLYFSSGDLTIQNSTISGNWAAGNGGGMSFGDVPKIINSTIIGNMSYTNGGGINGVIHSSNVSILNNIAFGSGGGIYSPGAILKHTLLANNFSNDGPDCYGDLSSGSEYNLIGDPSNCVLTNSHNDVTNINPQPSTLAGSPSYMVLLSGNPAIDAGNSAGCFDTSDNPIPQDQRGALRPIDGNGDGQAECDIGSFEYDNQNQPSVVYLPSILANKQSGNVFDDFENPFSGWPYVNLDVFTGKYLLLGEYEIRGFQAGTLYTIRSPYRSAIDYSVEVDGRYFDGASYGLVFGIIGDFDRYYVFEVSPNNQVFHLVLYEDGIATEVIPWKESDHIGFGEETNHLKAIVNQGSINLELNGSNVGSKVDNLLIQPTLTGISTSTYMDDNLTQALFDNFAIILDQASTSSWQSTLYSQNYILPRSIEAKSYHTDQILAEPGGLINGK